MEEGEGNEEWEVSEKFRNEAKNKQGKPGGSKRMEVQKASETSEN